MYVKAPAKLNIFLDVLGKRKDGYHNLNMVMLPLELHDVIDIEYLPYLRSTHIVTDHVEKEITNYDLIRKTHDLLIKNYNYSQNFNITVHKEIPIFAGLGGGSANAAAVLKAFIKYGKLKFTPEEELDFCLKLGADVPYCMKNVPAHVEGIGEKVTPIKLAKQFNVLIIKPKQGLNTKIVFKESDKYKLDHGNIENVIKALEEGDEELLSKSMHNSLEKVSMKLCPEIKEVKEMLLKDGFKCVMMTGSGSCVYALTTNSVLAVNKYHKYEHKGYETILTKTQKAKQNVVYWLFWKKCLCW